MSAFVTASSLNRPSPTFISPGKHGETIYLHAAKDDILSIYFAYSADKTVLFIPMKKCIKAMFAMTRTARIYTYIWYGTDKKPGIYHIHYK